MKADYQSLAPRQNFSDRNLSFGPHLTIWRLRIAWESLIGAITVRPNSICSRRKTAIVPSEYWPTRSSPFLLKAVPPPAMEAGEQAFRKLLRLIIRDAYGRNPKPLPVIVFLHG